MSSEGNVHGPPREANPRLPASDEGGSVRTLEDDEKDFFVPRTFIAPEESDATKSTVEELEQIVLIKHLPDRKCHRICVLSTYPLRSVLHKPELSGRFAKWAIELGEYDIEYQPRTAIRSQILADFVADFSPTLVLEVEKELLLKSGTSSGVWTLFTDGATNVRGFGLGLVLKPPVGGIIRQSIKTTKLTNNEAEYKAMIPGLQLVKSLGAETVEAKCNSLLVDGKLPRDPQESRAQQTKAARFSLDENGVLYRRTFDGPLAICLGPGDTDYVLQEIHKGTCRNDAGGIRPKMRQVSEVRSHDLPARGATTFRFITMAIHEVGDGHCRPFANSTSWKAPKEIGEKRCPRCCGHIGELQNKHRAKTPFSLVYGTKALISVENEEPSARFRHTSEGSNNEAMSTALELLDERWEASLVRMAAQKQKIERYYNRRTNLRYFGIGDLVLIRLPSTPKTLKKGI
uniref:RNase H type-1 domain-containing protein n=1 Tax=Nicotiana tabacum TaxID=4097 RepID=A0A1S3XNN5_TOBAC|nr:PREDICTED: uncharacterized protein LOC107767139 [Nicotiana tabacum]